jgi:hypothetical protein
VTLPRRIQLVKLLKSHGLRGVERARDEDIKEALSRLRALPGGASPNSTEGAPSSTSFAKKSDPPPPLPDDDDAYALPRFREPKLFLPDHERTFLRAICVKPRLAFFTWDVHRDRRDRGQVWLEVRFGDFLGEAPDAAQIARVSPQLRVDVDLSAGGWYVPVPGERLAIVGTLMDKDGVIAQSNVSLSPPARPAPPGPLWLATLPPSLDRRALLGGKLLRGEVPDARLARRGESDARGLGVEDEEIPASAALFRLFSGPSSSSSGGKR